MVAVGLPALDNTMGALFLGTVLAMALWGAGSVQAYYYFNRYTQDDWRIKALVILIWALDTLHQGFITHSTYIYLITHYGEPAFLVVLEPSLLWEVAVSAIICLFVQCFFCVRIWTLSHKNIPLLAFIGSTVLGEFLCCIIYFGRALPFTNFGQLVVLKNLSRAINAMGAVSDVAIAATLIFLLHRSRTGFSKSEHIINRLILFTINTGLLTSICALMSLITITVFPNNFIYIMFYVTVSRLYTNSLMATLNARKGIRANTSSDGATTGGNDVSMSLGRFRGGRPGEVDTGPKNNSSTHVLSVKVDTETTRDYYPESNGKAQPPTYHSFTPIDDKV